MAGYRNGDRPRVLVFHPALAPYRLDLFNALARRVDLKLVFLHKNVPAQAYDQSSLLRQLEADCSYLSDGFNIFGRDIRYGVSARISQLHPDVIVTHEFSPLTLQVAVHCAFSRIPQIVWTADNPNVIEGEHPIRSVARKVTLPRIQGTVVYSEETRDIYRYRFGYKGFIGVCPNAQDEGRLRGKLVDALPLSRSLVSAYRLAGQKVLLYVGRLAHVKRVDRLIRGFSTYSSTGEPCSLVIVGDGPERHGLERLASDLGLGGRVLFLGHREDRELYAWFNIGGVLALTSEFEPWGAVINEALIAGMPAICSERAGARVLITSGVNGDLVVPTDAEQIQGALNVWLHRANRLDATQLAGLRPSLMNQPFSVGVDNFLAVISKALGKA